MLQWEDSNDACMPDDSTMILKYAALHKWKLNYTYLSFKTKLLQSHYIDLICINSDHETVHLRSRKVLRAQ
jgi:hypothetical protein